MNQMADDQLSIEYNGYSAHIFTHGGKVGVVIDKQGTQIHSELMNPAQFISLLLTRAGRQG